VNIEKLKTLKSKMETNLCVYEAPEALQAVDRYPPVEIEALIESQFHKWPVSSCGLCLCATTLTTAAAASALCMVGTALRLKVAQYKVLAVVAIFWLYDGYLIHRVGCGACLESQPEEDEGAKE
jgi:hypothetical protein